jgi:HlyD family secretion protein
MTRKKVIWTTLILLFVFVAFAVGAFFYFQKSSSQINFDSVIATERDLVQIVSVTGSVQPVNSVNLAFEVTGRVEDIFVEIGDRVAIGDPLIKLVNTDISSELAQASANLQNEQASLDQFDAALLVENALLQELERGTRAEEVQVSLTRLNNAKQAETNAQLDLDNVKSLATQELESLYDKAKDEVMDAYLAVDNALNVKTDSMFSTSLNDKGDLVFNVDNPAVEADVRSQQSSSFTVLSSLASSANNFPSSQSGIDGLLVSTESSLDTVQIFLFSLIAAISDETDLSDADKVNFQTNVNLARTDIALAQNSVSSLAQSISSQRAINKQNIDAAQNRFVEAQNNVELTSNELLLSQAETLPERIASQKARIAQASANIQSQKARIASASSQVTIVRSKIEKTILRAPIEGVITSQGAEIGEIVSLVEALSPAVISIISDAQFEIETNIPEVDITKLELGDHADITLDAYGESELFSASVKMINPAETIIEGVPTYKVTLWFDQDNEKIKSGMTANIDIMTASVEGVIAVPQRTVTISGMTRTVQVFADGEIIDKTVETGLTSWDGQIEIISGVNVGDEVITFIEE